GQRVPERQCPDPLGQVDRMAANHRPEGLSAADENTGPARAVPGIAGSLLLVNLLLGTVDLRPALALVGACLPLGQLPLDHAVQNIGPRLQSENMVGQIDRTSLLGF